jgi:hypothetical protein
MPEDLSDDEYEEALESAKTHLEDEDDRGGAGSSGLDSRRKPGQKSKMSDTDLIFLRKRFPFLADLSDEFVRSQSTGELLKMETTALKMKMMEQSRDYEDRLASNKMSLEDAVVSVPAGKDDRWNILHEGRYLPGATCSAKKQWLRAREIMGMMGAKAVGSYDMGAVGMGGFVTSRGWCELHNPGSSKNALRWFSINNCAAKASSSARGSNKLTGDEEADDIIDLGEFKLALRTLRVAASMVMPWNLSYVALENFLFQSNFCHADLQQIDQPARILTQFVDYVLKENSNRWRDSEAFLDTGALKATWDSFFGAKPQSQLGLKAKSSKQQDQKGSQKQVRRAWVDICFDWNMGRCLKAPGTCVSNRGTPLRHVCNFQADRSKPNVYCEKAHARTAFH